MRSWLGWVIDIITFSNCLHILPIHIHLAQIDYRGSSCMPDGLAQSHALSIIVQAHFGAGGIDIRESALVCLHLSWDGLDGLPCSSVES